MLTRRVSLKPNYSLFGNTQFAVFYPNNPKKYQSSTEIVELACTSFMQALRAERPMSIINGANTHWVAYYWRNLPIETYEKILTEDGEDLDTALDGLAEKFFMPEHYYDRR